MKTVAIITIAVLAALLLGILIYYIIKGIKEKWLGKLIECVYKAVKEAEQQFGPGKGKEKQIYVLKKVRLKCEELKVPYAIIEALVIALIKQIVAYYNVIAK